MRFKSLSDGTDAETLINEYVTNNSEHFEDTPPDGSDSHGYHHYITITPISETNPGRTRYEFRNNHAFAALRDDGSVVA